MFIGGWHLIEPEMLKLLACPRCDSRPPFELRGSLLVCEECGWGYRIVDGIPHLLLEEAIAPDVQEDMSIEPNA